MRKPTLIVYLDVKPAESLNRIKMRGRSMESSIPLSYLDVCNTHNVVVVFFSRYKDLYKAYEDFVEVYFKGNYYLTLSRT